MKRKIALAVLTTLAISMFSACGNSQTANSGTVTNNGTSTNTQTESEVLKDETDKEDKTVVLSWIPLAELTTYQDTLRLPMEEVFNTKLNAETGEKEGNLYRDRKGFTVQNNTLYGVIANITAKQIFERDKTKEALSNVASNTYIDLVDADEDTKFYMAINAYFNLLPDAKEGYSDFDSTLTRAEFMAMLMRAETPVSDELQLNMDFTSQVGETEFNLYAQQVADHAYINTSDKSLNKTTYIDKMTRIEAIYLLMNHYLGVGLEAKLEGANEFNDIDPSTSTVTFTDIKDGGNITELQGYKDKNNASAFTLQYAINNASEGLPTNLYKALVLAEKYGLVDVTEDTRWEQSITKSEAIEFIYKTLQEATLRENIPGFGEDNNTDTGNTENNTGLTDEQLAEIPEELLNDPLFVIRPSVDYGYYYDEFGCFDAGLEEAGITQAEDEADGWIGFQCYQDPDGTPYCIHNKSGERFELGEKLPGGQGTYTGSTPEEYAMWEKMVDQEILKELYGDTEE